MSKITFRADADLVDRLESLEGSKSEVMREALRAYLDDVDSPDPAASDANALDDALAARVDDLVDARLEERLGAYGSTPPVGYRQTHAPESPSVNLTVNVEGDGASVDHEETPAAGTTEATDDRRAPTSDRGQPSEAADHSCAQCGESVSDDHVYCPNCGEKTTRRLFCDCGDELRSDWGFCPSCGRRTPAADVLDGR